MSKIVYVADSRVSNTPVALGDEAIEELDRRICTLSENFCIITTSAMSLDMVEEIRRIISGKKNTKKK